MQTGWDIKTSYGGVLVLFFFFSGCLKIFYYFIYTYIKTKALTIGVVTGSAHSVLK